MPLIERLAAIPGHGSEFVISVDTMKPALARLAVKAGAAIINDVGGLRDPEMIEVVKEAIEALNESGYLQYLSLLNGKRKWA